MSLMRSKPPFRGDQVGSLLRTERLKAARQQKARGDITSQELWRVENEEIARLVEKEKSIGLQAVTDGEFRRAWWHYDFFENLMGVEGFEAEGLQFQHAHTVTHGVRVTGKIDFGSHPMLEHFKFLNGLAGDRVAKMTIPGPSMLHFRAYDIANVYPDEDEFFRDVANAYQKAIRAFYDAGCRYLQLDDTAWAYLCSKEQREEMAANGRDVEAIARTYAETTNRALANRPSDMQITMHICRGNFRSTWMTSGGYEPVAETIFGGVNVDGFFLEYDSERAGGFEPLRFVRRKDLQIVLGLITSKTGALEDADTIKRRIGEATRYVPLDQLCLSPQCGFASTEEGNVLTEDEQWAKLGHVLAIADAVWG